MITTARLQLILNLITIALALAATVMGFVLSATGHLIIIFL